MALINLICGLEIHRVLKQDVVLPKGGLPFVEIIPLGFAMFVLAVRDLYGGHLALINAFHANYLSVKLLCQVLNAT